MPRKNSRATRQTGRNRRTGGSVQRATGPATSPAPEPVMAATSEVVFSSARTAPATTQPRVTRRPATATAAGASLSTDLIRNETKYIRGDLIRLLVTSALVIAFMIGALLLLN